MSTVKRKADDTATEEDPYVHLMDKENWWESASSAWWDDFVKSSPELEALLVEKIAHNNPADLTPTEAGLTCLRWISALEAIDQRDDHRRLLALLQDCVPPEIFPHLEDLFTRKKLRNRNKGRQRTPSYEAINGPEIALRFGIAHVKYLVKGKMSAADALAKVAEKHGIPQNVLENAYYGRRGATRRRKQHSAL